MGIRISYFKTNSGKSITETITENYTQFRKWYLEREQNSISECGENIGNLNFINYLKKNPSINLKTIDQQIVDELFEEMVIEYYHANIIENIGSLLSKWRYEKSNRLIKKTKNKELIKLWKYVTQGRSLKNNIEYNGLSNDIKMGYLLVDEQNLMKKMILDNFGNIEQIRDKYWVNLNQDNYAGTGIELVLEVLNEIENKNSELIIGIEQ